MRQSAEAALKGRQKLQEGLLKCNPVSQPQPSESHEPAQVDIDITPDDREHARISLMIFRL